jgi:hypothetical protein
MTNDKPTNARPTARELLSLPLATLTSLLRQAMDETRAARRREHWLRAIRAMKLLVKPVGKRVGR